MFQVMPGRPASRAIAFFLAMVASPTLSARAQSARAADPARDAQAPPVMVEQGVADRNSLAQSLRVQQVDLSPHGFERVYQVPGRDDLLMRTNGALYAVFDQSTYGRSQRVRGALRAVIPAATVFYIGRPDFKTIRSSGVRDLNFSVDGAARAPRASSALDQMHGVQRLEGTTVDGRSASPGAARLDARVDGRVTAGSGPQDPPSASRPVPEPSQPAVRAPAPSGAPGSASAPQPGDRHAARESDPAFQKRIDELMQRARKAQ